MATRAEKETGKEERLGGTVFRKGKQEILGNREMRSLTQILVGPHLYIL